MAETKTVRLAMIGCGGMAEGHLRAYQEIHQKEPGKVHLAACCDADRSRAQQFSDQMASRQGSAPAVYTDYHQMLGNETLDAADIATPHSDHHRVGIDCLDAGVHIQVEKPIGITVRATRKIIEASHRNHRIAATAENVRRGLSQRTAHWLINDRKMLGTPRQFFSQAAGWSDPNPDPARKWHWRVESLYGGGGMVMDSGAHYCDTIQYLFGPAEAVFASVRQLERRPHDKQGSRVLDEREDTWVATIQFESGLVGLWSWTIAAPGHDFSHVVYYGSEACLLDHGDIFHGPFSKAELIGKDGVSKPMTTLQEEFLESLGEDGRNRLFPYGWQNGVVLECYDFLGAIQTGRQPEVNAETGLRAKSLCEAIYESAAANALVQVKDVIEGRVEEYQRPINDHWGL
jgi:UDP-N-acetyl-2-amino-2-deoxyglucuronate dehydrogenase